MGIQSKQFKVKKKLKIDLLLDVLTFLQKQKDKT